MKLPLSRLTGTTGRHVAGNVAARVLAMAAVAVATVAVGRADGAAGVGLLTMLRVLPGLLGVLMAAGLPGAIPYFLADDDGTGTTDRSGLRPTIVVVAVGGALLGAVVWCLLTPALAPLFFQGQPMGLVAWAAVALATQLLATTAKATCQGSHDLRGANLVIVAEEAFFLPAYAAAHLAGLGSGPKIVAALIGADVATAAIGWARLAQRGFFARWGRPSLPLGREIVRYGAKGQLGGLLTLLNLRLDFAILGAIAGPSVLGVYAVASKVAEIMRLVPVALTYVWYPALRRLDPAAATARARALLPRAGAATAASALPVAGVAIVALPLVYGPEFRGAVVPACILLVGLSGEGAAAVASAWLYARGHPGLNSIGIGAGVAVTAVLDAVLIPAFGATGAAVASSVAYLTAAAVLTWFFLVRSDPLAGHRRADVIEPVPEGVPT